MTDRTKSGTVIQRSILAGLTIILMIALAIIVSSPTGSVVPAQPYSSSSYFVTPIGSDSNPRPTEASSGTTQRNANTAGPAQSSSRNTYYVSTTGSDRNPGTLPAPFRTIQKGVSVLKAGDTLYLRSGTYLQNDTLTISRSGTSTARITIATAPGEPSQAIISGDTNGNGAADATDNRGKPLVNIARSYVTFQNIEVVYSGETGIMAGGTGVTISGNRVHDIWGAGIYSYGPNSIIEGNTVWRAADSNYCGGVGGSRGCNRDWGGGISWGGTDATPPPGKAPNAIIRNNTVFHVSGEGILGMQTDGALVEGNTVYDNWGLGIYLDQCSTTTIRKNLIYYTGDTSWWRGGTYPSYGILLSNEGIGGDTVIGHDRTIVNNIIVGAGAQIGFWVGRAPGSALINDLIADNQLVEAQGGSSADGIEIDAPASGASHTNTRIGDNLVLQSTGTMASVATTTGLTFDHNLWSRAPSSNVLSSSDVVANPLLADPNHTRTPGGVLASWYELTAGSPAIQKAAALSQVTDDYFGDARPSTPDIGAHQYQESMATSPVPQN